jgi:hypothetical protein
VKLKKNSEELFRKKIRKNESRKRRENEWVENYSSIFSSAYYSPFFFSYLMKYD